MRPVAFDDPAHFRIDRFGGGPRLIQADAFKHVPTGTIRPRWLPLFGLLAGTSVRRRYFPRFGRRMRAPNEGEIITILMCACIPHCVAGPRNIRGAPTQALRIR
jgi:hypothetical protein